MAVIRYPLSSQGLMVSTLIGLSGRELVALHVTGNPFPPPLPARALIGMDVLAQCRLIVDGPAAEFSIEF